MPSPDPLALRKALSHFATGVTVVTTLDQSARLVGFTASSFTSVSLDPPLVLVCVNLSARSYPALLASGRFGIHVLESSQEGIARSFARGDANKSAICDWSVDENGYPRLQEYQAFLACRLERDVAAGDHAILVGRVEAMNVADQIGDPLLFYKGQLRPLGWQKELAEEAL